MATTNILPKEIRYSAFLASATSGIVLVISLFAMIQIQQEISGFWEEVDAGVRQFRESIEENWNDLRRVRREVYEPSAPESKPPGISTNTNAACNCATGSSNKCPAGIPGPKGVRGKPGNDGKDGLNGVPGKDASDVQLAPEYERCYYCPSGQQGTVGPTGKSGPRGMKGVNGKPGVAGRDGQPGSPGDNGPPGAQGVVGQPGPVGEKGRDFHQQIGRPGSKGPKGPPGPQGPIGNPGMPAPPGPPGETPGERGNPGPLGEVGKPGPTGFEGNNGKPGPDAHYCSCPPPSFTSRTKSNGSVNRGPYNYYFGMSRRTRV
uniref:Nematode cuticle collagen N-terminal domain-containing protein n=1 Tax=Meloidogyne floridensis TaxID=298350 RepID=A0A915PB94_9BILA